MHPEKILYITPALSIGGAEKFLILLSNSLVNEKEKQILVSLQASNSLQGELDSKIHFLTLPRNHKFDPGPIFRLRKLIKEEQPATIFCINFYSYLVCRLAMIGLKTKSKRIISYHSTIHVTRKEHLLHKFYSRLLTRKDLVVTVSSNQAAYTARVYGIRKEKFLTIHNGINLEYWKPLHNEVPGCELRKKYGIDSRAKVIVMTAALRMEKNHTGAVKALKILHSQYGQKAYLLLVGDGIMRNEIQKLADELDLLDYVIFSGMQKEVRPFYWASDLFTLCSTSVETFSIAALEAMACGLPCVLTDIGGASEMIRPGINGYLSTTQESDIAEKWDKALNESFSREKINTFTRDNFSSEKMLAEYRKIL